jgi:hypothetical protein
MGKNKTGDETLTLDMDQESGLCVTGDQQLKLVPVSAKRRLARLIVKQLIAAKAEIINAVPMERMTGI